jgi:excinuclease ABC subunit C
VLYVGKAKRLSSRVRSYFSNDPIAAPKDVLLRRLIADVETVVTANEAQSLLLENNLIKEYRPRFNVRLKDDKSYPSIAVTTGEPFPRVLVTRRRDMKGARYFGPFTDVSQLRRALAIVRRIYTVRSCADDIPRSAGTGPASTITSVAARPVRGLADRGRLSGMIEEVLEFLEGRTQDIRLRVREQMTVRRSGGLRARKRASRRAALAGEARGDLCGGDPRQRRCRRDRVCPGRR